MSDARTPRQYFQERDQQVQAALDRVRDRLDDLKNRLDQLKAQRATTKAHQQIRLKQLDKLRIPCGVQFAGEIFGHTV